MQEQVEQNVREKAELQRELDVVTEEKETLRGLLEKQRQEAVSLEVGRALAPRPHTLSSMCSAKTLGLTGTVCFCRMSFKGSRKKTSH